jgi:hypothetical protein
MTLFLRSAVVLCAFVATTSFSTAVAEPEPPTPPEWVDLSFCKSTEEVLNEFKEQIHSSLTKLTDPTLKIISADTSLEDDPEEPDNGILVAKIVVMVQELQLPPIVCNAKLSVHKEGSQSSVILSTQSHPDILTIPVQTLRSLGDGIVQTEILTTNDYICFFAKQSY